MRPEKNEHLEEVIMMQAVVDAYDEEERAMGWYYFLEQEITFPFTASKRSKPKAQYHIIGHAEVEECEHDMFVKMRLADDELLISLSSIQPVDELDEDSEVAIEAWHYWCDRGYRF